MYNYFLLFTENIEILIAVIFIVKTTSVDISRGLQRPILFKVKASPK